MVTAPIFLRLHATGLKLRNAVSSVIYDHIEFRTVTRTSAPTVRVVLKDVFVDMQYARDVLYILHASTDGSQCAVDTRVTL